MTVYAQKTVFSNGEQARFFVTYSNETSYKINKTKIALVKIDECCARNKADQKNSQVQSALFEGADGNSKKTIEVHLTVPQLTPSSDRACKVVNIFYEVHITATFDGALDHTMKIPVFILAIE
jgi:hypothetical protein